MLPTDNKAKSDKYPTLSVIIEGYKVINCYRIIVDITIGLLWQIRNTVRLIRQ